MKVKILSAENSLQFSLTRYVEKIINYFHSFENQKCTKPRHFEKKFSIKPA